MGPRHVEDIESYLVLLFLGQYWHIFVDDLKVIPLGVAVSIGVIFNPQVVLAIVDLSGLT